MVYVTGDCHGDFRRFSTKNFPEQKEMTRDDTVIVCGDFGCIWNGGSEEEWWLKWLSRKKFTICFVDGNHENMDRLAEFPIVDYHGGKAHKIKANVFHLMRGYVFEFDGKKFWCFGGAQSHDIRDGILDLYDFGSAKEFYDAIKQWSLAGKMFRINHVSWWKEELPSEEEMQRGRETLSEHGNKVDYIITHCPPQMVASCMGFKEPDIETLYFNEIAANTEFKRWVYGHLHYDWYGFNQFQCIYERIERLI